MGRTLKTTTQILLEEERAFADFRRALRPADQRVFDELFAYAHQHRAAITMAAHALPFEAILLAMLLEAGKKIDRLNRQMDELRGEAGQSAHLKDG
jgi:hypothetical protein